MKRLWILFSLLLLAGCSGPSGSEGSVAVEQNEQQQRSKEPMTSSQDRLEVSADRPTASTIGADKKVPASVEKAVSAVLTPPDALDLVESHSQGVPSTPVFLDIEKNRDGSLKKMNQDEAIKYCDSRGAHLPSALEFMQFSQSFGAKGRVKDCRYVADCETLWTENDGGIFDIFRSEYLGYQPPSEEMANIFWTSSGTLDMNSYGAYAFYGKHGFFLEEFRHGALGVRCVAGRSKPYEVPGQDGDQVVAKNGAIFTRDKSNPKLGEAYRDTNGLVWNRITSPFCWDYQCAQNACNAVGARLPSRSEFNDLVAILGGSTKGGGWDSLSEALGRAVGNTRPPEGFNSHYSVKGKTEVFPGLSMKVYLTSYFDRTGLITRDIFLSIICASRR